MFKDEISERISRVSIANNCIAAIAERQLRSVSINLIRINMNVLTANWQSKQLHTGTHSSRLFEENNNSSGYRT